jgi:hypothetical protein
VERYRNACKTNRTGKGCATVQERGTSSGTFDNTKVFSAMPIRIGVPQRTVANIAILVQRLRIG